jgi:hypothetical protein
VNLKALRKRAKQLFPDSAEHDPLGAVDREHLRRQWIAAVVAVRKTRTGWIADRKVLRVEVVQLHKLEKQA